MDQKIVLIVGAGDYIGSAIARRFAKGGFTVCLGRRNGEKLEPIIKEIGNLGGVAYGFTLDARKEENVVEIFKKIELINEFYGSFLFANFLYYGLYLNLYL